MRAFWVGILAAIVFTVVLNASTIVAMTRGQAGYAQMGTSVDEAFYFALIRDTAEGHVALGNASLREHRTDIGGMSYAPWLQGLTMRVWGLDIITIVLAGDVLFPMIVVLLFFVAMRGPGRSDIFAALAAFIAASAVGAGFLRSISPQVTLIFYVAYVAVFLAGRRTHAHYWLRGLLIALMIYLHAVYAVHLLLIELLDAPVRWRQSGLRVSLRETGRVWLPIVIAIVGKVCLSMLAADTLALADLYRRLGTIPSHWPPMSSLQLLLPITAAILAFSAMLRTYSRDRQTDIRLLLLVTAGFLALNQSIIHGIDVIFGLYYTLPLTLVLWLAWMFLLSRWAWGTWQVPVAACIAVWLASPLVAVAVSSVRASDVPDPQPSPAVAQVLERLQKLPGEHVVLAPYEIANLVPVFTRHYALFTQYARYQQASDAELAERYLLQLAVFPSEQPVDPTYNEVFGLYAGNLAARHRTACVFFGGFRTAPLDCPLDIRGHIYHQELLSRLDARSIDPAVLLQRYGVDILVTDVPLPQNVDTVCRQLTTVEQYRIYGCEYP